jgi:uncharacterized membrane protein (UPF0127 family)
MRVFLAAIVALAFLSGCSPGHEKRQLPTTRVVIDTKNGPAAFDVEVAADDASREKGLMFRTELAPNAGMLFDFGKEGFRSFWMKNTPRSLDIIFIRGDGTISTIAENTIPYSEDSLPSSEPVLAVLEINGGRSHALGIEAGNKVRARIFGAGP